MLDIRIEQFHLVNADLVLELSEVDRLVTLLPAAAAGEDRAHLLDVKLLLGLEVTLGLRRDDVRKLGVIQFLSKLDILVGDERSRQLGSSKFLKVLYSINKVSHKLISIAGVLSVMREGEVRTTDDSIPAIGALQLEAGNEEARGQGEQDFGVDTLVVHPDKQVRVSAHHVRD